MTGSVTTSLVVLAVGAVVLLTAGVRFTRIVDELADRTGVGEAIAGAVLLGASTSMPGLITTILAAHNGEADLAVSNAAGGIAAQTTFLVIADLIYRGINLEHAAASLPNLLQAAILVVLIGSVLMAAAGPEIAPFGVHPASLALVGLYVYGLLLVRRIHTEPMWRPRATSDTVVDDGGASSGEQPERTLGSLWRQFAVLAVVVAGTGFAIGRSGLTLAQESGVSGTVVGALLTAIVTSLPELVTVLTAVRIGALTLAVSNIVGGNTFDVLFVAAGDVAYRGGSIYHAIGSETTFVLALTIVLTAMLVAGLLVRDRRYIGFEGIAILATYLTGCVGLVWI